MNAYLSRLAPIHNFYVIELDAATLAQLVDAVTLSGLEVSRMLGNTAI